MATSAVARRPVLLGSLLVALALTGCTSGGSSAVTNGSAATPGSNGAGTAGRGMNGSGMMGGGSGYVYSRLTCSAPTSLPGRTVAVMLADMGMTRMMSGTAPMGAHMQLIALPATAPAGQVSLVASNVGWRTHELVILPLAAGAVAGQRVPGTDGKVTETGSLGEASNSCAAGSGGGIRAGTVGWTTVTLAPGHYELICNLSNHYADGMRQELVVT